ncbi:alpha/beta fold hydrolase [Frankia sp. CNm7]|uniref:Alpha/beta fold hydrolase n=1 Tax=Frankia nepalensis TaxID=1836974 RepID=A0A937RB03_9ACTN|nr:epoxide hydrolase [Frankia nepalensis]MBL7499690.1 alpha/beta fold hydrolase [Frankia nepalensis]MBL7515337.1 alpha/beta fold hydrolase [Frankia nepalensis]MBL7517775.1 alpha/beta fold hydrolase [Frankia nepalensis]MBL7626442.1 alpha/beta fold hydrolase [Frankia nepalensis]
MDIQPFTIAIPQADVDDLADRLARTRWPASLPGDGWSRGVPLEFLRELADYWATRYDWRAAEARLNALGQFTTEIDGQRIHFTHVRSERPDALALLITHGYPSSFVEFTALIEHLRRDFHVVAPSVPGFGFSTPVRATGWAMGRTARAWAELMRRLGYDRYGTHGGDIGAGLAGEVASVDGAHVVGVHVVTDPLTAANTATFLPGLADGLDPADPTDRLILDRMDRFRREGSGYLAIQNSRPQTIGYLLNDSPVGQLGWIAEKFEEWTDLPYDRDQLLTNVSLYWFTGSGVTAAGFLYEQTHAMGWTPPAAVPHGFAVFGADPTVRRVINPSADTYWAEYPRGLHFPAMEAPEVLAADLRTFFGKVSAS